MAEIRLEEVTKRFSEKVTAVDAVSLDIASGEFLVLVGPSGCGKSTLLRMIAGLEEVTEGSISIGGNDVTELNRALRRTHSLESAAATSRDPEAALAYLRAADKVIQVDDFPAG